MSRVAFVCLCVIMQLSNFTFLSPPSLGAFRNSRAVTVEARVIRSVTLVGFAPRHLTYPACCPGYALDQPPRAKLTSGQTSTSTFSPATPTQATFQNKQRSVIPATLNSGYNHRAVSSPSLHRGYITTTEPDRCVCVGNLSIALRQQSRRAFPRHPPWQTKWITCSRVST